MQTGLILPPGLPRRRTPVQVVRGLCRTAGAAVRDVTMEYHQWWSARQNVVDFGQRVCDAWASEYLLSTVIWLLYNDGTGRPVRFEAGVQDGSNLLTDMFINNPAHTAPLRINPPP